MYFHDLLVTKSCLAIIYKNIIIDRVHSNVPFMCPCRFFSDDASSNNGGYRAASYVVELRDKGYSGFLLPPNKVCGEQHIYHTYLGTLHLCT